MTYEIINDAMLYRVIPRAEQDFLTFTILEQTLFMKHDLSKHMRCYDGTFFAMYNGLN